MIDWTIKIGDIVLLGGIATTAIFYSFRSGKFAESIDAMKKDLIEMKDIAKEITHILTKVAVQDNRLTNSEERQNTLDKRIEDLRRGNGYIQGDRGVNREY